MVLKKLQVYYITNFWFALQLFHSSLFLHHWLSMLFSVLSLNCSVQLVTGVNGDQTLLTASFQKTHTFSWFLGAVSSFVPGSIVRSFMALSFQECTAFGNPTSGQYINEAYEECLQKPRVGGGGKSKSWVSEKNCLNKVPLELCSEGQKESRESVSRQKQREEW